MSEPYRTVTVAVEAARLRAIAAVEDVEGVFESLTPEVGRTEGGETGGAQTAGHSCSGAATSEGDAQLRAHGLRSALNIDGGGRKVGVLSDSFDADVTASTRANDDVASGDLPGPGNPCGRTNPVQVLAEAPFDPENIDEGRAMAQIVHDLAPGARLAFATAFTGELAFANNIRALRNAGADVIVDDVTYFNEPFFQDGPISVAVSDVSARGAAYFSSAANGNLKDSSQRDIASWETPAFRTAGACPSGMPAYVTQCLDFDPDAGVDDPAFRFTVAPFATARINLQWAQPWFGVTTDLDAYIRDPLGNVTPATSSEDANVVDTQQPFEFVTYENPTASPQQVELIVNRYVAANGGDHGSPRVKFVFMQNGGGVTATEYPESSAPDVVGPTIFGHNGAANASSVAAVPYDNSATVEAFSSRGPVRHYFGPVSGTTPARPVATRTLAKPDIAATNRNRTTFFIGAENRFPGTSAAAPHAAAVAALQRQANPSLTPAQVRAGQAAGADPVGAFGPTAVGAGLLDALGAAPAPLVSIAAPDLTRDRTPTLAIATSHSSALRCSVDGGSLATCGSRFTTGVLGDGQHTVRVVGTNVLGRSGASTRSFRVDATTPNVTISSGPRPFTRNPRPRLRFAANETPVRFQCRFDRRPSASCDGSFRPASRLGNGTHRFQVQASDAAGNVATASRLFTVDTKRPSVRFRGRPARRTASRKARFSYVSSEKKSTFRCSLDGRKFKRCKSTRKLTVRRGRHTFRVRAVDRAGNVSRARGFSWRVRR